MKKNTTALILALGLVLGSMTSVAEAQATIQTPTATTVVTTPNPLVISLTENGTNVPIYRVELYRLAYMYKPWGEAGLSQFITNFNGSTSVALDVSRPYTGYMPMLCGDYFAVVQYTDDTGYHTVTTSHFRILTDYPQVWTLSPSPASVVVKGQTYQVNLEVVAKPGYVMTNTVCLTTPAGHDCSSDAELSLFDVVTVGSTNVSLSWQVPTTDADGLVNGHLAFPDGDYILNIYPDSVTAGYPAAYDATIYFTIDSASTVPAVLNATPGGWNVSCQANRSWWPEESTDLIHWTRVSGWNMPARNGSFVGHDAAPSKFFRLHYVE